MILKNCNLEEFIKRLNGRKIICFGAGSLLKQPIEAIIDSSSSFSNYIDFFVDNDSKKCGLLYEYNNKYFKVYDTSILNNIDADKYVLLITNLAHYEIYNQLEQIPNLANVDCYFYQMIIAFSDIDINYFYKNEIYNENYKNWKDKICKFKNIHRGKRCFIIGNGPSLNISDLNNLKNEVTFSVNRIYLAFGKTDWRPTYYVCSDPYLYNKDINIIRNIPCKAKFTHLLNCEVVGKVYDDIIYYNRVSSGTVVENNTIVIKDSDNFSYDISRCVYSIGGTVLYHALQIAVYMGFSEIYLLGVDCNFQTEILPDGTIKTNDIDNHFIKEYDSGFENIMSAGVSTYKLQSAWQSAKKACERVGVTIKNATRGGKLEVFERVDFDELMKDN